METLFYVFAVIGVGVLLVFVSILILFGVAISSVGRYQSEIEDRGY